MNLYNFFLGRVKIPLDFMKYTIFLKVNIFEDRLNFLKALYQKYITNITFKEFTKWYFTLWFYNSIKKWAKENKKR